MNPELSLESRKRAEEYRKQWDVSPENLERAYRVMVNFYGPTGFPGPEPGSPLWAAYIIAEYAKAAGIIK